MIPIRPTIHLAIDYGRTDPENMTLREVVEYYKRVVRQGETLGTPTDAELRHISQAWGFLMKIIAEREGIPQGWLNYVTQELARSEMAALSAMPDAPA